MSEDVTSWKRCSTCKKPLAFGAGYWTCNVSTCNRGNTALAFCSVDCWDAHVPLLRHRDAWAEEQRGPSKQEWERKQREAQEAAARASERAARPVAPPAAPRVGSAEAPPQEVLVIASRMKAYIRARSGMNTSDAVMEILSDRLRALADDAIERARGAGRLTVLDRDVS